MSFILDFRTIPSNCGCKQSNSSTQNKEDDDQKCTLRSLVQSLTQQKCELKEFHNKKKVFQYVNECKAILYEQELTKTERKKNEKDLPDKKKL